MKNDLFDEIGSQLLIDYQHSMEEKEVIIIDQLAHSPPPYLRPAEIIISVSDPELNNKDNFYSYKIMGADKDGPFEVRRRYSEFDLLRKKLCHRWLGIYIPPISGKRSDSNPLYVFKFIDSNAHNQSKYAQTRKAFLEYFCRGLALRPFLFYCDLFQLFIRGGSDYQKIISPIVEKEYNYLLKAYNDSFSCLSSSVEITDLNMLISSNEKHLASLKQSQKILHSIYQKIFKATQCREEFNNQFMLCMGTTLPDYEQKILINHFNKNREELILQRSVAFSQELNAYKAVLSNNPLEKFLEMIMYEVRETKAFIEAIQGRKEAQKRKCELIQKIADKQNEKEKLEKGEFTFKSFFKGGSKETQLNELTVKIQILKNELTCLQRMIVMMVIDTNYEVEQYRFRRGTDYNEVFKKVSDMEMTELTAYEQLLKIPLAALE